VTAFYPISPLKAVEMVEAAGVPCGKRFVAGYTAAGLVRSYSESIETVEVDGRAHCVRGAAVPQDLWQRIVREGVVEDVWTGGTVRLAAAELIGGVPEVRITGIGFSESHLQRAVDRFRGGSSTARRPKPVTTPIEEAAEDAPAEV
jgi:hypothetical protein